MTKRLGERFSAVADKTQKVIRSTLGREEYEKVKPEDSDLEKNSLLDMAEDALKVSAKTQRAAKKFATNANQNIKLGAKRVNTALLKSRLARDRKNLRPVFLDDLLPISHIQDTLTSVKSMSPCNMLRIVERDRRRESNIVSRGAIGYWTSAEDIEILNLYIDEAEKFGISFYPELDKTVYYVNLFRKNLYISVNEYFAYLKKARAAELELIASELGAKKVTITLKEYISTVSAKRREAKAKIPRAISASTTYTSEGTSEGTDVVNMEIAANLTFSGHDSPREPKLLYFEGESDIEQLIKHRTDDKKRNNLISKTYSFQSSKSSGIKESTAAKIDAALVEMGLDGTFSDEAKRETRTILEYHIEF